MANVGDRVGVGHRCPQSGQYKHSICINTIIISAGDIMPACQNRSCPNPGADWILSRKET